MTMAMWLANLIPAASMVTLIAALSVWGLRGLRTPAHPVAQTSDRHVEVGVVAAADAQRVGPAVAAR